MWCCYPLDAAAALVRCAAGLVFSVPLTAPSGVGSVRIGDVVVALDNGNPSRALVCGIAGDGGFT